MSNLALIEQNIYSLRPHFEAIAVDRTMSFEREAGFAMQIIAANDFMTGVAFNSPQSVIDAVTNVAAIGISLNPAKKQGYLVPRKGRVCLDISYMGLLDMAMATGSIRWAQAGLVYSRDIFLLNGFDKAPTHQHDPFSTERGQLAGVYVVVRTADGDYLTHCMSINDVYAIRNRSEAYKSGKSSPWNTDEGEMVKKTCVKQAYKYWPKTERLQNAIQYLNTDGEEGISLDQSTGEIIQQAKPRRASEALAAPTAPVILEQVLPSQGQPVPLEQVPEPAPAKTQAAAPVAQTATTAPVDTGEPASPGECMNILKVCKVKGIDVGMILADRGIDLNPSTLAGLTKAQFKQLKGVL
jgi:recombination protein RecT